MIQDELNVENLTAELKILLEEEQKINAVKKDYDSLFSLIQGSGNASANAAQKIYEFLVP